MWELDHKKAEHQRADAFKLWCWRRLLRVPWTIKRSHQSILKELNPEYSLEGLMLKSKLQYFGHSLEKTPMLGKMEGKRRMGWQKMRELDSIADWMDMNLSKLQETVKDREAWGTTVHGSDMTDWTTTRKNLIHHCIRYYFLREGQLELPSVGISRLSFLPEWGQGSGVLERTDEGDWSGAAKRSVWSLSPPSPTRLPASTSSGTHIYWCFVGSDVDLWGHHNTCSTLFPGSYLLRTHSPSSGHMPPDSSTVSRLETSQDGWRRQTEFPQPDTPALGHGKLVFGGQSLKGLRGWEVRREQGSAAGGVPGGGGGKRDEKLWNTSSRRRASSCLSRQLHQEKRFFITAAPPVLRVCDRHCGLNAYI